MAFEKPVVIIDNGSYMLKAGFACDNHPVCMFRTVVGRPNYLQGSYGREYYDVFIGDDAIARIEDYELQSPVVKGKIVHWDNMERVWHHVLYRELKVAPEDRGVLLTTSPDTTMADKLKCCEVFFETLNIPAICIQPQPVLALYASGVTTGLCVDVGHDTVEISPVYEGGVIKYARMVTNYAGAQMQNYLKDSICDQTGYEFGIQTAQIMEEIQEQVYVTPDAAMSRWDSGRTHVLSDGRVLDITNEAFMAGEIFFQPEFMMSTPNNIMSLQDAVVTSVMKCDADLRMEMYEAVTPCGGLTQINGLQERLLTEIEEKSGKPVHMLTSTEAYCLAWCGGAVFAALPDWEKIWILKKQYEDYGLKIVRNKFMFCYEVFFHKNSYTKFVKSRKVASPGLDK